MAYQTATANDPADLLDKLRLFLIAAGWTVDFWGNRTVVTGKALSVHKSTLYATFLSDTAAGNSTDPGPYLGAVGHTGYTANANPDVQSEASAQVFCNFVPGPYRAYHFFEGAVSGRAYVHVVVETAAGVFKPFGTGLLVPQGTITSGQYVYATRWNYIYYAIDAADSPYHVVPFDDQGLYIGAGTQVRADVDGVAPRWNEARNNASQALYAGFRRLGAPLNLLSAGGHSTITGRAPTWPLWSAPARGSGYGSDLGYPPDLRFCRMDSYEVGEVLTLGADTWKVFPVHRKNGPIGAPNSGVYGMAYRVVT